MAGELKLGYIQPVGADQVVVEGKFIKGGYLVVADATERDALIKEGMDNLVDGSLCFCQGDGKFYKFNGTVWQEISIGSGGTVKSITAGEGLTGGTITDTGTIAVDFSNVASKTYVSENYVAQEAGKGLSTNDYTDADKTKLDGIEDGAEKNVQSDWNVTDTSSDAYILNKPTIPAAPGTLNTTATTAQATVADESLSGNITLHSVAKTGNADKVDGLHLNDQAMAYLYQISTEIGIGACLVVGELTESEIFALTPETSGYTTYPYLQGKAYHATDTDKYYRCFKQGTFTEGQASYWQNDTTRYNTAAALTNQVQDEPYIFVKINTQTPYYSALPKFFITANYDNVSGSTTVTGYARAQNKFTANSCGYNGSNIIGIYQPTANTNIYYLKLKRPSGTYPWDNKYSITPVISVNFGNTTTAELTFIGKDSSEYAVVSGYSYFAIPDAGLSSNDIIKINGSTVGNNPVFTDTNVLQTATNNNNTYSVLFAGYTGSGSRTSTVALDSDGTFTYNPYTNNLRVQNINGVAVGDDPKFTDTHYENAFTIKSGDTEVAKFVQSADKTLNIIGDGATTVTPTGGQLTISSPTVPTKVSELDNDSGFITADYHDATKAEKTVVDGILEKIPTAATSENQLADKDFVNSSIATSTSTFRGTYDSLEEIEALEADLNDYAFYRHVDTAGNTLFDRYKYTGTVWVYEYTLNNSSFTSAQWAAINSGITQNSWVNLTTSQEINGQKDFLVLPRNKETTQVNQYGIPDTFIQYESVTMPSSTYATITPTSGGRFTITEVASYDKFDTYYFGNTSSLYPTAFFTVTPYASSWYYGVGTTESHAGTTTPDITNFHTVTYNTFDGTLTVDGTQIANNVAQMDVGGALTIRSRGSSYATSGGNLCVKEIIVYKDNITNIYRHLYPVYNTATLEKGFYDVTNEGFYAIRGSGSATLNTAIENTWTTTSKHYPFLTSHNFSEYYTIPTKTSQIQNDSGYITSSSVGTGNLVLQKNGTDVATFGANSKTNITANFEIPTKTSDITNDSNYITNDTAQIDEEQVNELPGDLQTIREQIAGLKNTYVCSSVTNPVLNSATSTLAVEDNLLTIDGTVINYNNLNVGDTIYVTEADVFDRWVSGYVNGQLPTGYTQLSYLYSDGTQYVNTNVSLPTSGKFVIRNKIDTSTASGNCSFGALASGQNRGIHDLTTSSAALTLYVGTGSTTLFNYVDGDWHTLEITWTTSNGSGSGTYRVDSGATTSVSISNFDSTTTLGLFCRHLGSGFVNGASCYISNCEIYEYANDTYTLRNKYIPCYNNSGAEGLFDYMNGTFFANSGAGTFIRGEELSKIGIYLTKLETAKVPITSISKNGTVIEPVNSNVNITVPTKTSDLENDDNFIDKDVDDLTYYTKTTDLPQEIYWCTYGVTTFDEISTAIAAGKLPMCKYGNNTYVYSRYYASTPNWHIFISFYLTSCNYIRVRDDTGVWDDGGTYFEQTSNKVNTLSASSTTSQYPNAKCVYLVTEEIREIAEGKKNTYVVSTADNPSLKSEDQTVEVLTFTDINSKVYTYSDVAVGDTVYIKESDYADRWISQLRDAGAVLPSAYQEVTYIRTNRLYTQAHLTTQITWSSIAKIIAEIELETPSSGSNMVFRGPSGAPYLCTNGTCSGITVTSHSYTDNILTTILSTTNTDVFTIGGWSDTTWTGIYKYHQIKLYNADNELICHLYPCYRKSDAEIGMYDIVNDVFYINEGTNPLTKGDDVFSENIQIVLDKLETVKVPITSISVNGTGITPINGNVEIGVPTKTSQLENDSGYVTGLTFTNVEIEEK